MKIFTNIKKYLFKRNSNNVEPQLEKPVVSMHERERMIYGEDKITRQRLYEKWSSKEKWLLHREGIPLLYGLSPETELPADDEMSGKIEDLWVHAKDCVRQRLLSVINRDLPEEEWQVKPVDLYCWAMVSRISMPDELSYLMAFVVQTVKSVELTYHAEKNNKSEEDNYQRHREITLGATVSLLTNSLDLCKNRKGKVVSRNIAALILNNAKLWFSEEKPLLAQAAMEDLINQYIKQIEINV